MKLVFLVGSVRGRFILIHGPAGSVFSSGGGLLRTRGEELPRPGVYPRESFNPVLPVLVRHDFIDSFTFVSPAGYLFVLLTAICLAERLPGHVSLSLSLSLSLDASCTNRFTSSARRFGTRLLNYFDSLMAAQ